MTINYLKSMIPKILKLN